MKRFCLNMAAFCLLSLSALGCSMGEGSFPSQEIEVPQVSPGNVEPPASPEGGDPPGNAEPGEPPEGNDQPAFPGSVEPPTSPETGEPSDPPGDGEPCDSPESEEPSLEGDCPSDEYDGNAGGSAAPWLVLNELRTEAFISSTAPAHTRRVEFIELRALSAGNLGGLRLFFYRSGSNSPTEFEFPDTKVNAGEYVVLHLRTLVEDQFVDAYPDAHNFWLPGMTSLLNANSAVYVQSPDGRVLDAVMLSTGTVPSWWARVAGFLFDQGAWKSSEGGIASTGDAVDTANRGVGVTWSVSRNEGADVTGTVADWYISTRATPGRPNE